MLTDEQLETIAAECAEQIHEIDVLEGLADCTDLTCGKCVLCTSYDAWHDAGMPRA